MSQLLLLQQIQQLLLHGLHLLKLLFLVFNLMHQVLYHVCMTPALSEQQLHALAISWLHPSPAVDTTASAGALFSPYKPM
jgi:hypothetical protein